MPIRNNRIHISHYLEHVTDLKDQIRKAELGKCDSTVVTIQHPFIHRRLHAESEFGLCLNGIRPDTILSSEEWYTKIIAKLSEHLDVDSVDEVVRKRDEEAFVEELNYVTHLIQNGDTLVKLNMRRTNVNLARLLVKHLKGSVIVEIPMKNSQPVWRRDVSVDAEPSDPWLAWNSFRQTLEFHPAFKLALTLTEDIPSESEMNRWFGEPIAYIIIPSCLFILNHRNCPVLPRKLQDVVRHLLQSCSNFMIKTTGDQDVVRYSEYVDFLAGKHLKPEQLAGYENLLETPLQPLHHNLDAYTYEVFERDPAKYNLYQQAIELALSDTVPKDERETRVVVVFIVGAGRGPLVRATINAGINTGIKTKIVAVEKNPNVIPGLVANIKEIWYDSDVTLFSRDMRDFNPPEKADIIVSELLGSFGDNELSPECLDGAQKHLKPNGISIPANSVSFANPVMSTSLYNSCRAIDRLRPTLERGVTPININFETTYVVYPKNVYNIADPKKIFTFEHPNLTGTSNNRSCTVTFTPELDCILHGFMGYFESTLYKDIVMSIHPFTHTMGMSAWFAFYFPIVTPQFVNAGQEIEVKFWRCGDAHKVWYEWAVMKPLKTHIHNVNGESCNILK